MAAKKPFVPFGKGAPAGPAVKGKKPCPPAPAGMPMMKKGGKVKSGRGK